MAGEKAAECQVGGSVVLGGNEDRPFLGQPAHIGSTSSSASSLRQPPTFSPRPRRGPARPVPSAHRRHIDQRSILADAAARLEAESPSPQSPSQGARISSNNTSHSLLLISSQQATHSNRRHRSALTTSLITLHPGYSSRSQFHHLSASADRPAVTSIFGLAQTSASSRGINIRAGLRLADRGRSRRQTADSTEQNDLFSCQTRTSRHSGALGGSLPCPDHWLHPPRTPSQRGGPGSPWEEPPSFSTTPELPRLQQSKIVLSG